LNFDITDPSQFVSYTNGIDGILPAQQSGYPAMLNHPGSSGGVSDQEAISTQGEGADLMEVRQQSWIDNWDAILKQGVQLLGTGTSDTHRIFSGSSYATYVYGPALTFDELVHSIFEGRTFIAVGSFGKQGPVIFNLNSASQEPYPARYPVYVPDTQSAVNVHLAIPAGANSGYTVRWVRNDVVIATDTITVSPYSYDVVKSILLDGPTTYIRAEVRNAGGGIRALTQPIFFKDVAGLPADKRYHVDEVITTTGRGYTKLITKGISASNWNAANQTLSLALENATGSLVRVLMHTGSGPQQILVDGATIFPANSVTTFDAATGSSWYYDSANTLLYLKVKHTSGTANVAANFSGVSVSTLTPTATASKTSTATNTPTASASQTLTPTYTPTGIAPSNTPVFTGTATTASTTIFADVPAGYWAGQFIERLYQAGITGGCGNGNYCPASPVTRAQMAVFLLRAEHGSSYAPPSASGNVYGDVPAGYWAAAWIEQLAAEGITGGCGSGKYCPDNTVTREQMAVFLLRAKYGSGYLPPAASGTVFVDVLASHWAGSWIEQLVSEGITAGCSTGLYCPIQAVTRDQMAVFLIRTFALP
jgi:hypothetical protein